MTQPKVFYAVPTYKCVGSLTYAEHQVQAFRLGSHGLVTYFQPIADMYITVARNTAVQMAIDMYAKGDVTHLFMIDDDVVPPEGFLPRMLSHGAPVVSGLYHTRNNCPCVYNFTEENKMEWVWDVADSGVMKSDGAGAGCLLIDVGMLVRMQATYRDPFWFDNHHTVENGVEKYQGEDVHFFRRLKQMGTSCLVDLDVDCRHASTTWIDRATAQTARCLSAMSEMGVTIREVFELAERIRSDKENKETPCSV